MSGMADTKRTLLRGGIFQEISRDLDVVSRRLREANSESQAAEASTKAEQTGEPAWFGRTFFKGGRCFGFLFIAEAGQPLCSMALIGKRHQAGEMAEVFKRISDGCKAALTPGR
jgi:hypothetical protein